MSNGFGTRRELNHQELEALRHTLQDTQLDLARLSEQVRLQRKVIEKLVQLLADTGGAGEALLQEPEVRELLHLSRQPSPGTGRETGRVLGKLRCPSCQSVIDDKEGVTDERCHWCGAQLSSAR
jgi:hypothetical protein